MKKDKDGLDDLTEFLDEDADNNISNIPIDEMINESFANICNNLLEKDEVEDELNTIGGCLFTKVYFNGYDFIRNSVMKLIIENQFEIAYMWLDLITFIMTDESIKEEFEADLSEKYKLEHNALVNIFIERKLNHSKQVLEENLLIPYSKNDEEDERNV